MDLHLTGRLGTKNRRQLVSGNPKMDGEKSWCQTLWTNGWFGGKHPIFFGSTPILPPFGWWSLSYMIPPPPKVEGMVHLEAENDADSKLGSSPNFQGKMIFRCVHHVKLQGCNFFQERWTDVEFVLTQVLGVVNLQIDNEQSHPKTNSWNLKKALSNWKRNNIYKPPILGVHPGKPRKVPFF